MTEQDREKLVEAMCYKYIAAGAEIESLGCHDAELFLRGIQEPLMHRMRAALAAIDASRIAWVAPGEATEAMVKRGWSSDPVVALREQYAEMRDACLAERRGEVR